MTRSVWSIVTLGTIILTTASGGHAGIASFQGLGDLPGDIFSSTARDISADDMTIVGSGINPDGHFEAWIATLPEPGTFAVLGLGMPMLLRRRRGKLFWPSARMGREQYELNQENGANPPWH